MTTPFNWQSAVLRLFKCFPRREQFPDDLTSSSPDLSPTNGTPPLPSRALGVSDSLPPIAMLLAARPSVPGTPAHPAFLSLLRNLFFLPLDALQSQFRQDATCLRLASSSHSLFPQQWTITWPPRTSKSLRPRVPPSTPTILIVTLWLLHF